MRCPGCSFENTEDRKTCARCGGPLGRVCDACGRRIPARFKFCGHCGAPQGAAAAGSGTETGPGPEAAERRQVTALVCDLVDSVGLSERLELEDYRDAMRLYHETCHRVVAQFGGSIADNPGDASMFFWGHPEAYENAAERAVRAGLEITEVVGRLQVAERLRVRVGVATGLAIVGAMIETGGIRLRELIGEPPNLAARLEKLAAPNSVVISAVTRSVIGDVFIYDDLGKHSLKGFSAEVRAFAVAAENVAADRFEARAGSPLPQIVDRDPERTFLRERWHHLKNGRGHVVLVSGEPGIGKSRLVRDLREYISNKPHRRLSYAGSPLHQHTPLYPVAHGLERAAGIDSVDTMEQRRAKLGAVLMPSSPDSPDGFSLIEELVGAAASSEDSLPDTVPERRREQLIMALLDQLSAHAARQPVLLVFEDVQWIDATTWELLEGLMRRVEILPVLLLVTFRTGVTLPLNDLPHVTALVLGPLDHQFCIDVVRGVSHTRNLPHGVTEQIVARTDGVPLFIEELTKAVLESQDEPMPFAVPETLRDALMARLGRSPHTWLIAQIAATIGREFPYELLAMLAPMPAVALQGALNELLDSGLIFARGSRPRAVYSFKHALVQEVAYDSQLRRERRRIHRAIAATLQEHFPETLPEMLGHHFAEAGATAKSIAQYKRAARASRGRSANVESAAHFARALELLETLPAGPKRDRHELDLQIAYGAQLFAVKGNAADEVGDAYGRALDLANQLGETSGIARVLRGLLTFYVVRGLLAKAHPIGERLLAEAERASNPDALLQAHRPHGLCLLYMGDLAAASHHLEQALSLYDPARHAQHRFLYGSDPGALANCNLAWADWFLGHPDRALQHSEVALKLAEQPEPHPHSQAFALSLEASLHQFRDQPTRACARAEEVIKLATDHDFAYWRAWGQVVRGWARVVAGAAAGLQEIETGLVAYRATGSALMCPYFLGLQADACGRLGRIGDGLAAVDEALTLAQDRQIRFYEPELHRLKAELLALAGAPEFQRVECLRQGLTLAHRQGSRSLELRAATTLCRHLTDPTEQARALDQLRTLVTGFDKGPEGKAMTAEARAILESSGH